MLTERESNYFSREQELERDQQREREYRSPLPVPPPPQKEFDASPTPKITSAPEKEDQGIKVETTNVKQDSSGINVAVTFPSGTKSSQFYPEFKDALFFALKDFSDGKIRKGFSGDADLKIDGAVDFGELKSIVEKFVANYQTSLPQGENGNDFADKIENVSFYVGSKSVSGDVVLRTKRKQSAKELIAESKPKSEFTQILKYSILAIAGIALLK